MTTTNRERGLPLLLALLAVSVWCAVALPDTVSPAPLFAATEELELALILPLRSLLRERARRPEVDAALVLAGGDAGPTRFDVEVTPRGRDRLARCSFPPLGLNFKRGQVGETLFAGQNRLKLVTLCGESASFARYLELEYFAYRMYQQVSDFAFRVRPVRMRYVDTEKNDAVREAPAFLVEHIDGVAARVGMAVADATTITPDALDPRALAMLAVFQFMIGNTDWAATGAVPGERCCHNADVLAPREGVVPLVLVPFDFDHAGIVDADYAEPDERLGIRSVRQRLYRGLCIANPYVEETIHAFNAARPAIEALLPTLTPEARAYAARYVARSYEILNDADEKQRQILDGCRRRA